MIATSEGWAVVEDDSGIDLKTVTDTRRAALVNWLHLYVQPVFKWHSDADIEEMWERHRGAAIVSQVRVQTFPIGP